MKEKSLFIGKVKSNSNLAPVEITTVEINKESFYKISNSNKMRPFFMSVVSDSNHWMFISSNGALTAGRKNSNNALFPYYTDDKITESVEITGSKTILQIHKNEGSFLWEPFSDRNEGVYNITRNLYKNEYGNKLFFEEINNDLNVTFKTEWNSSNLFGFVKKSTLINNSKENVNITFLDGIQNIIPFGLSEDLQNTRSNLVDAYKKNELDAESGIGIFALSAIIVDKAEPSEALKATMAWSLGVEKPTYLVSSLQLNNFRKGKSLQQETDVRAEKGAYFVSSDIVLKASEEKKWMLIANVNQTVSAINDISNKLKTGVDLADLVQKDIDNGTQKLVDLTGNADGLQVTADTLRNTRHFANTMFNNMRGGIFDNNYQIEKADFIKYIANANKKVLKKKEDDLANLPEEFSLKFLKELAENQVDKNFKRLCFEYMPLKFSRRHGDPSRPWNKFSINTNSEIDGSKILDYQGNWRDIFQNWEALAHSYPNFIESMLHKFLNATTFEGYNPYRVTKDGFDWEVIEPNDPWSFIGYWGDHQIIYLLKFLEFIENYFPNKLESYFEKELFVYANVPYKIKKYEDILKNPKDTIEFDAELDAALNEKKEQLGADGALLRDENYFIYKVNLIEKLLVTVLAKVSNFIPEAGIWMNTQRPEWNDANNALVGNGVSMVTLFYVRRFLNFFEEIVSKSAVDTVEISSELATFFNEVTATLDANKNLLAGKISDKDRKTIIDGLGIAASDYRTSVYEKGFSSDKNTVSKADLLHFTKVTLQYLDHSIKANKRADHLYHSYNLMTIENDSEISISYLAEMLEGQVAVLSAGCLSASESIEVLDALQKSALYRKDQNSYLLYPNKELARFLDKNKIPSEKVKKSELLQQLLRDGNTQIIEKDCFGNYHFNGNFNNATSLEQAFNNLPEHYEELILKDKKYVFGAFEAVFNHKSFTGRSGTFYGYEGLGSIYWHMVSKLVLAVQEVCLKAINNGESNAVIQQLSAHYYEMNDGIGVHKSPEVYGAFPTDPYSHTPAGKGAQQPGMTGQVKEDVLSRFGELGVFVKEGTLYFNPILLKKEEFLKETTVFNFVNVLQQKQQITLEKNSIGFTYCQVPIVYQLNAENSLEVFFTNATSLKFERLHLDNEVSAKIFDRTGEIEKIVVTFQ